MIWAILDVATVIGRSPYLARPALLSPVDRVQFPDHPNPGLVR
jgi:hypothetical protein